MADPITLTGGTTYRKEGLSYSNSTDLNGTNTEAVTVNKNILEFR